MALPHLDPSAYTPMYVQIADRIRGAIADGSLAPGARIPSEAELMQQYGVGRNTAIGALEDLVRSRHARRVRGRGTFVTEATLGDFSLAVGFAEGVRLKGLTPTTRLLGFKRTSASADAVRTLKADPEADLWGVIRLRLVEDEPVALQEAYLPVELYPGLDRVVADGCESLYALMRERYGLTPRWAEASIGVQLTTADEADLLDLEPTAPALLVWHLTTDGDSRPLEYVRSLYRTDRFTFVSGRQPVEPVR